MASKSPSHSKSVTNSTEETQSWSPPPPPKRTQPETQSSKPVRKKTRSTRLKTGIDKRIPGVTISPPPSPPPQGKQKDISVKEPSQAEPRKKNVPEASEKGKEKAGEKSKKARRKRATSPQAQSPPRATKQRKKEKVSPFADNAIEDICHTKSPPEGFTTDVSSFSTKQEHDKFKETYLSKVFCASVAINIAEFHREFHFDLSPWIRQYESFVSLECPYTPSLVRMFYFKMEDDSILDEDGELVEEKVSTTVRGVKFSFSADTINKILKVENPPPVSEFLYTNQEVYETLIPGKPFPPDQAIKLTFRPSEMPKVNRLLWYIFSRNFIHKGGNYTHFTSLEYRPFTAFVRMEPLNIGHWLFQGMKAFKFAKKPMAHIPYPSLVSVILFYHKIWYVGSPETLEYPLLFGKHQLNLMRIKFDDEGVAQSQASHINEEAQSAPPPSQAPLPADLMGQIQHVVDSAIARLTVKLDVELGKIRAEMTRGHSGLIEIQDAIKEHLQGIEDQSTEVKDKVEEIELKMATYMINQVDLTEKVDKIIEHLHHRPSSSGFAPGSSSVPDSEIPTDVASGSPIDIPSFDGPSSSTPVPESPIPSPDHSPPSHSFSFPSPPRTSPPSTSPASSHTPATVILSSPTTPTTEIFHHSPSSPTTEIFHDPIPSPVTPSTEIFTLTPSEVPRDPNPLAMVVWTPPIVVLDPEYVDDDKGGEESNEH